MNVPFSVKVTVPPVPVPDTFTPSETPEPVTLTFVLAADSEVGVCPGAVTVCWRRLPARSY